MADHIRPTETESAKMSTQEKWSHIFTMMTAIQSIDSMHHMRRRLNPHHSEKDKKQEDYNVRLEQYERWVWVKNFYATYRDELANTQDNPKFAECKSILERVFTEELDKTLRDIIGVIPETIN